MKRGLQMALAFLLGGAGAFAQTTITSDTNQADSSTVDAQYLSSAVEGQFRLQQLASDTIADTTGRVMLGDKVPGRVRRALEKGDQYKGWERDGIRLDEATNLYVVSISEGSISRTYGFNAYGKPVLVTETFRKGPNAEAGGGGD